jgi:thymidylate kinase
LGYLELARGDARFVTLDGTQPPEELARAASLALDAKLAR